MTVYRPLFWPCFIASIFVAATGNAWLVLGLMWAGAAITIGVVPREKS